MYYQRASKLFGRFDGMIKTAETSLIPLFYVIWAIYILIGYVERFYDIVVRK